MIRFFALCLVAAPSLAQTPTEPGLTMRPGDSVAFRLKDGVPVSVRALPISEDAAAGEMTAAMVPYQGGTLLMLKNGGPVGIDYRAYLQRRPDSRPEATSTCTLLANGPVSAEHWPYPIAAIRLTEFMPATNDGVVCR